MAEANGSNRPFDEGKKKDGKQRSDGILERTPPCSTELEDKLICCMLIKSDVCDDVTSIVRASDLVQESHGILFESILAMHEKCKQIEIPLLIDGLKRKGVLDRVGGIPEIMRIAGTLPHGAFAKDYAIALREYSARRRLIDACTESIFEAYDGDGECEQLLATAEQRIFNISDDRATDNVQPLSATVVDAIDRLDMRLGQARMDDCLESGFPDLDHLTAGFHRGELTVLAARPSMGKTALALNIAEHVAIEQQAPVLFVSLEMAAIELTNRLLCSRARVDGQRLRRGVLSQRDQSKLVDEAGRISSAPLYIDETTTRNVTAIGSAARRVRRNVKRDIALIVVDYLQLVEPDNSKDSRQEQVARIARRLKTLARDLKVPILCLAQLNRQAEMTKDSRPRLSHLRESGAIEQDADVVMFIHREDYYLAGEERDENKGRATLMVAKQRNGPIGDVELLFHDKFARFVSAERREREPDFQVFSSGDADPFGP